MGFLDTNTLPDGKTTGRPVPAGADPNQWVTGTEWNNFCQAVKDLRLGVVASSQIGFTEQASAPTAYLNGGGSTRLWAKTDGQLVFTRSGVDNSVAAIPVAAKGDLAVWNGTAWAKLPVGTNTQVLTADSTQAAGVKWAPGGAGAATLQSIYDASAGYETNMLFMVNNTIGGMVIKDAATPITSDSLFTIQDNAGTSTFAVTNNGGMFAQVNRGDNITTNRTLAFQLSNGLNADAVNTVRNSPGFAYRGSAWNTSLVTSQFVRFRWYMEPVSGASVSGKLNLYQQIGGGAETLMAGFDTAGGLTLTGTATVAGLTSSGAVAPSSNGAAALGMLGTNWIYVQTWALYTNTTTYSGGGAITIGAQGGREQTIQLGATAITSITMATSFGSTEERVIVIKQDATGGRSCPTSWTNVVFRPGASGFVVSPSPNAVDTITFEWDAAASVWREKSRTQYDARFEGYTLYLESASGNFLYLNASGGIQCFGAFYAYGYGLGIPGAGYYWEYAGVKWVTTEPATTVASAATITPTTSVIHVTGTAAISTIAVTNVPAAGCNTLRIIPDGAFTLTTGGNIAKASTAVVGQMMTLEYDLVTAKWYPSY